MPRSMLPLLFLCAALSGCAPRVDPSTWNAKTPVAQVLQALGRPDPSHLPSPPAPDQILLGHELVFKGRATAPDGATGPPLSVHFVCVDCHLTTRDQPDLARPVDDASRLAWLDRDHLPLLPGSSLAGVTDRETWFNGDWPTRPGWEQAASVRKDLRRAIRFCAMEVARGRRPEGWEEEAILSYLTSLRWTLGDLDLTSADLSALKSKALDPAQRGTLVRELTARFRRAEPASFGNIPADVQAGYPLTSARSRQNGERVWHLACLHCHGADGASSKHFRDRPEDWRSLARRFTEQGPENLYHILRNGSDPLADQGAASMPIFTQERMSDAMIEDLRAWLEYQLGTGRRK